jgi:transposase
LGGWRPQRRQRPRQIDPFSQFVERRGPEVDWNAAVLHRELCSLGFSGSYQQVRRFVSPLRADRRWAEQGTVRFETGPGEQAQVDFGETQLWITERLERVYLFMFTLRARALCGTVKSSEIDLFSNATPMGSRLSQAWRGSRAGSIDLRGPQ